MIFHIAKIDQVNTRPHVSNTYKTNSLKWHFWNLMYIWIWAILFIQFPLMCLSRFFNIFFWLMNLCLYQFDPKRIGPFQFSISLFIGILLFIWMGLFISSARLNIYLSAIAPIKTNLWNRDLGKLSDDAMTYHEKIVVAPIRRKLVLQKLGPDIGPIVLSYLEVIQ